MNREISCDLCGSASNKPLWTKDGYRLVRCSGCSLVYMANPPSASELKDLYSFSSGYHAGLVQSELEIARHLGEARANLRILERNASSPGVLLDVGCSTGLFLDVARRSGWDARGLEYSPDSGRVARERHQLQVDEGALLHGRYPAASFDVVTMWDVIEHIPSPSAAVDVVFDILKPGGLFLAKTPNVGGLYPSASLAVAEAIGFWGHPEPPGHLFQFSTATLADLVQRKGFKVQRVHHQRIPIAYSFGTVSQWFRSAKWLAYVSIFAPMALAGPVFGLGDTVTVVAQKP